jgi:hypothetical protein
MDIINRLTLEAAKEPKSTWAKLLLEAAEYIQELRKQVKEPDLYH